MLIIQCHLLQLLFKSLILVIVSFQLSIAITSCQKSYTVTDLYAPILNIVSKEYGAANVTVTVDWTQLGDAAYNVKIFPSVPIIERTNSCQLTIPYNTEYNLTVEASAPCKPNNTAFINLRYGEVEVAIQLQGINYCSTIYYILL